MWSVHSKSIAGGEHEQYAGIWSGEAFVVHIVGVVRVGWGWGDTCVVAIDHRHPAASAVQ